MGRISYVAGRRMAMLTLMIGLSLLLGAFSAFVGWNKALAPLEVLREHSAWTIHLPFWLGRLVGWLEMASVAALLGAIILPSRARWGLVAAGWITLNHTAAAIVHVIHREWHTLPQSAVMITLCLLMTALWAWRLKTLPRPA